MVDLRAGSVVYGRDQTDVYEITEHIGGGAFGKVYKVTHRTTGNIFALKTIEATDILDTTEHRALLNEGQLALNIVHPNVVKVFYFHNGIQYADLPPYIIMEYVTNGYNLQKLLDSRKSPNFFSIDELVAIYTQLALGMQAINRRLVHRDIKPDNILVQNGVYKISDFGLSKVVGAATRSQTFKGLAHIMYCAPEAWKSEENLPLMDMYSMGIVFFQLASLSLPYTVSPAPDPFGAWRDAHLFKQATDPRSINPDLDTELSQMVLKMMSKRPMDRYQSWDEVLQRLNRVKNVPEVSQDISSLLQRDIQSRRVAELEALETEKQARMDQENEAFLEYSFNQILQVATQVVDQFNESSDFTKLRVEKSGQFSFSIQKNNDDGRRVIIHIEPPPQTSQFQMLNFGIQGPTIKVWGIVKAPSGHGFNLVLVSTGQEDLYEEWRVIHKTLTYPTHMLGSQTPRMTPFEMSELPSNANRATSRGLYSDTFSSEQLIPLIEEIL